MNQIRAAAFPVQIKTACQGRSRSYSSTKYDHCAEIAKTNAAMLVTNTTKRIVRRRPLRVLVDAAGFNEAYNFATFTPEMSFSLVISAMTSGPGTLSRLRTVSAVPPR